MLYGTVRNCHAMSCTDTLRKWARECCGSVEAWNVTTTLFTAFFLAVGTVLLVQKCYVPDNQTLSSECASKTTVLFADKWVLVVLIACVAFAFIVMYQILRGVGLTCMASCKNKRHNVFLAFLAAACAAVYADFVASTLRRVPTSPIEDPDACFVCPNGRSQNNLAVVFIGVAFAFVGAGITMVVACKSETADSNNRIPMQDMNATLVPRATNIAIDNNSSTA